MCRRSIGCSGPDLQRELTRPLQTRSWQTLLHWVRDAAPNPRDRGDGEDWPGGVGPLSGRGFDGRQGRLPEAEAIVPHTAEHPRSPTRKEMLMTIRKLDKSEWRPFFDRISKALIGKRAEVEVASLALGDQIEVECLPLIGIAYDPKDDILEVALDGVDHPIPHPQEIYIDETTELLNSLEVIDRDGTSQIVHLRNPLMLPAPSQAAG
jgi:hypothetical protein